METSTSAESGLQISTSQSPRGTWEILTGEDKALPITDASSSGDLVSLQTLLSQPQWSKAMFDKQRTIYYVTRTLAINHEDTLSDGQTREVSSMLLTNLVRVATIAALKGHAAIVTTLLAFAAQHGVKASEVIWRMAVWKIILAGHADVIEAIVRAWPGFMRWDIDHGNRPLYEAVRRGRPKVVAVLLKLGADPFDSYAYRKVNLMHLAAKGNGPRMIELLLDHGVPIADTQAIHSAASVGQNDTIRFLMEHGADVNEISSNGDTPMHHAAHFGRTDTMAFLEIIGANPGAKNDRGETPAEKYERVKEEKQVYWTRHL
ncbi:hypothetical protein AMS68_002002 [Peltaster fructicola]|uniref:Uncharacterized protein n=1 Tax=Peltaster fructicola TaxID=286661 RepID=A0A6H0XPC5_9PEZI|nr:hypothetical protein AMS68_002002 [Peltaster fructicola]